MSKTPGIGVLSSASTSVYITTPQLPDACNAKTPSAV